MGQLPLFNAGYQLDFADESQVRTLLAEVSPLLWHAVHSPWDEFQLDRAKDARFRDLTEGQAAWWLHTQIIRTAKSLVDDCPEFGLQVSSDKHPQFYLNLRGELVIVFKKLIRRWSTKAGCDVLLRSNYLTKHNCDFWQQRKESAAVDAPRVILGYEPIREMTEIRVHVGYPRSRGRRFSWIYEMPGQVEAAKRFTSHRAAIPEDATEQRKGFVLRSNT